MDFFCRPTNSLRSYRRSVWALMASCLLTVAPVTATEFRETFDTPEVICTPYYDQEIVELKLHERTEALAYAGQGSERFQFVTNADSRNVVVEIPIEPARIFEELRVSIAVSANRPGTQLAARVVFPHQIDPETNEPVTRLIIGDTLSATSRWQELNCAFPNDVIAKHLILWRASLKPVELDPREMYIDRIYLRQMINRGMTELLVDQLRVTPVVPPDRDLLKSITPTTEATHSISIDFHLDRLSVEGRPIFPILFRYQKESWELWEQIQPNVLAIDDLQNQELILELNRRRYWVTAPPPKPFSTQGNLLSAESAGLTPIDDSKSGILFWNLGVRIPAHRQQEIQSWIHQVKTSDRQMQRPVFADVSGAEMAYSRDVDLLGISKHVLFSPEQLTDLNEHWTQRKREAQPGTFLMSWLQTEPSREIAETCKQAGLSPPVVEPEQIRLQTYMALCAGCRGVGYWNWTPLDVTGPGQEERRLVLEQLSSELHLLEPFLASGEVIDQFEIPMQHSTSRGAYAGRSHNPVSDEQLSCSLVRSGHGLIILLAASEPDTQYVPGPLAANDLKIRVRSLPESAFLWQITPTGLWPLETVRKAGGTEIRIPRFNMTAALMVATDQIVAQNMEQQIQRTRQRQAEIALRLAEEKFQRVSQIDTELIQLGVGLPSSSELLQQSRRLLDESQVSLQNQHHHQARENAEVAGQLLRILQRLHWRNAVKRISSPTSSPHAVAFQTLPDHWKLIQRLGREDVNAAPEIIQSANFEDASAMQVEGWTRDVTTAREIVVYDALDPAEHHEGDYSLRMVAVPAGETPVVTASEPSVRYVSPPLRVHDGDLVHVSGWIRLARPITGNVEGFRVYDTQYGTQCALKWTRETDWIPFEMLRPITREDDLQIVLELHGLGDVAIDQLQTRVLRLPRSEPAMASDPADPSETPAGTVTPSRALDLLKGLLK